MPSFSVTSKTHQRIENELSNQIKERDREIKEKAEYIAKLVELLRENHIDPPEIPKVEDANGGVHRKPRRIPVLVDTSEDQMNQLLTQQLEFLRPMDITVEYTHLSYKVYVPKKRVIPSVGTFLRSIFCFWENFASKKELRILDDVTGRIKPRKMTLLIGPPGSGKSVFLKMLLGKLRPVTGAKLEGDVFYEGKSIRSGEFIPGKLAGYVEQGDTLDALLTVEETLKFAWLAASGGHHSYGMAKDEEAAALLDREDDDFTRMKNVITKYGLTGCKDTYVGNSAIRGVSGGQKRRVTVSEIEITSRPVMFMDSISNGLDTATTYDIVRAIGQINKSLGTTILLSLLQPPRKVYKLFDEVIILSEGQVVYHGPREEAMAYFSGLGYHCPTDLDEADFLQELATPDGCRYLQDPKQPHSTQHLADAWKQSILYKRLLFDMKCDEFANKDEYQELGFVRQRRNTEQPAHMWYPDQTEAFPRAFYFYFKLLLDRQMRIVFRDVTFARLRIGQSLVLGIIAGSLWANIGTQAITTMNGFLFLCTIFCALGNYSIIPLVYQQKQMFYKHYDALFYPAAAFTLAQSIAFFPLQLLEQILFTTIVYWSSGLSSDFQGSRYFTFIVITLMFTICVSQIFRVIASFMPDQRTGFPLVVFCTVAMMLFSGYIQPKILISNGWIWFFWLNPMAWAYKALIVNQYTSPRYDFLVCLDSNCLSSERYGLYVLKQYGAPTDERYIWYSFAVLVAEYICFFAIATLCLRTLRVEPTPPPPVRSAVPSAAVLWEMQHKHKQQIQGQLQEHLQGQRPLQLFEQGPTLEDHAQGSLELTEQKEEDSGLPQPVDISTADINAERVITDAVADVEANGSKLTMKTEAEMTEAVKADITEEDVYTEEDFQLPFDPISFVFSNIKYQVKLPNREKITLLDRVEGYFEPGTMTALMGSSGAGKTTLLDVLAGRKNTGIVQGDMYLNGVPKVERYFRKIMAYVEQFDSLSRQASPREAVAFSAALRLTANVSREDRERWVAAIVDMLDLAPIQNEMIGILDAGGLSFEQRKRVSIGVELAANPSILFLDEPTTGLDSRAARNLIRNIRRIARSGRSIVCTIHQPSTSIFTAFDALLLLRRGGQTVFFGSLGEQCCNLIRFFESAPNVMPFNPQMNPATWMLEVIGAGTSSAPRTISNSTASAAATSNQSGFVTTDFHAYYLASSLCTTNRIRIAAFMEAHHDQRLQHHDVPRLEDGKGTGYMKVDADTDANTDADGYNASNYTQFVVLLTRLARAYWRSPSYTLARIGFNILLGLIFSSAYPQQTYRNEVDVVARSAVIYLTTLLTGNLSMVTNIPVACAQRPVFYREQQSRMYRVSIYAVATFIVEIPYILFQSLCFCLLFFFIVGFDNTGENIAQKFCWMWLFNSSYQFVMNSYAQFFAAILPTEATAQLIQGSTIISLSIFCGFLITEANYPTFWLFMYWLNPLHYALEGIIMAMFRHDNTPITVLDGSIATSSTLGNSTSVGGMTTAERYIEDVYFTTWSYDRIGFDVLALWLLAAGTIFGKYMALSYLRHDKR